MQACTISTRSHWFKCLALHEGLAKQGIELHVLLIDGHFEIASIPNGLHVMGIDHIEHDLKAKLLNKYRRRPNKLRWAFKPLLLLELLKRFEQVCYFDNDIDVIGNLEPVFQKLKQHSILLTPHHYPVDPSQDQNWMEANFRVGLYNAGFIGTQKSGFDALNWWAKACLYNIKQAYWRGLFDDQKYLDLLPVIDPNSGILHHRGCNVAAWNSLHSFIQFDESGTGYVEKDPLLFIHYAAMSLRDFAKEGHPLQAHCRAYVSRLKKYNPDFSPSISLWDRTVWNSWLYYIRWRWARIWEKP